MPPSTVKERDPETQKKIDRLRELRYGRKLRTTPTLGLPFPSSPPVVPLPPVSPPPDSTRKEPAAHGPDFHMRCHQCTRHLWRCTCGTAQEREIARKAADDRWFKADPKGWFDYHAPPQLLQPSREQITAELQRGLEEAEEAEQRDARRKAAWEATLEAWRAEIRAPLQSVLEELVMIAQERMTRAGERGEQRARGGASDGERNTLTTLFIPNHHGMLKSDSKKGVGSISLELKREALQKGGMTPGLKIWLTVASEKKTRPPGYVAAYDRIVANFAAQKARLDLLYKQRAPRGTPRAILQLLRHRDRREVETRTQVLGRRVALKENTADVEAKRIRDMRVQHLLSLWARRA
ncbi:hypothetical protein FB451DRAFT_1419781 [Mycena latifolia]|nr:hypothetical protein FB451DRAFT_1419781 [Mycena latifolia]